MTRQTVRRTGRCAESELHLPVFGCRGLWRRTWQPSGAGTRITIADLMARGRMNRILCDGLPKARAAFWFPSTNRSP